MSIAPVIDESDRKEAQFIALAKEILSTLREMMVTRIYLAIFDSKGDPQFIESTSIFSQYAYLMRSYIYDNFHLLNVGGYSLPFGGISLAFFKVSQKALIVLYAPQGPAGQLLSFTKVMFNWSHRIDELVGNSRYFSLTPEFQEQQFENQEYSAEYQESLPEARGGQSQILPAPLKADQIPIVPFTEDFYTVRIPVLTKRLMRKDKFPLEDMKILQLCDGNHTIEAICQKTGFSSVKVDLTLRGYQKKKLIKITKNMPPFISPSVQISSEAAPRNRESFMPPIAEASTLDLINQQTPKFERESEEASQSGRFTGLIKKTSHPQLITSEEESIRTILDEELPRLPEREKAQAIKEILQYTPGIPREAWLKIFLVKNKKYAKIT